GSSAVADPAAGRRPTRMLSSMERLAPIGLALALCGGLAPALGVAQEAAAPEAAESRLSTDDVRTAGRVIGLDFTDVELELMLPGVLEHLDEFERLRAPSLAN